MNPQAPNPNAAADASSSGGSAVIAWLFVGLPLAWGVSQTFLKALALFR